MNEKKFLKEEYDGFSLSVDFKRSNNNQVIASLKKVLKEIE